MLDRKNLIRLAREAGFDVHYPGIPGRKDDPAIFGRSTSDMLGRFADMVASAEREACARACEQLQNKSRFPEDVIEDCVAAIRGGSK